MLPIRGRVIVVLVFSGTTLSAEVAVCDVHPSVYVRLVLAHPTRTVRTIERRLSRTIPYLTARMAILRGVARVHVLNGDALLDGLVAYLRMEFGEPPLWRRRFMYSP